MVMHSTHTLRKFTTENDDMIYSLRAKLEAEIDEMEQSKNGCSYKRYKKDKQKELENFYSDGMYRSQEELKEEIIVTKKSYHQVKENKVRSIIYGKPIDFKLILIHHSIQFSSSFYQVDCKLKISLIFLLFFDS